MGRKRWLWISLIVAAVIATVGVFVLPKPLAYANIATGYAAQQTCACLHVANRSLEGCMSDFPEDARGKLTITQAGDTVHASAAFGLFKADAKFDSTYGCRLLN